MIFPSACFKTGFGVSPFVATLLALGAWAGVGYSQPPGPSSAGQPTNTQADSAITFLKNLELPRLALERAALEASRDPTRWNGWLLRHQPIWENYVFSLTQIDAADEKLLRSVLAQIATAPDSKPAPALARIQASFLLAEQDFQRAWSQAALPVRDSELGPQLELILSQTRDLRKYLEDLKQAETLARDAPVESFEAGAIGTREALLSRLVYLQGWTAYFTGVIRTSPRQERLLEAEAAFREFLQLDTGQSLNRLPADWLNLKSGWQQRAIVGLAIVLSALGNATDAEWCFSALKNSPEFCGFDSVICWKFQGLLWAGQVSESAEVLRAELRDAWEPTPQQLQLAETCLQFSRQADLIDARAAQELDRWGLLTLLRGREFQKVKLRSSANGTAVPGNDFRSQWLNAVLLHDVPGPPFGEDRNASRDFGDRLRQVIQAAIAPEEASDRAHCELTLAEIELELGRFESAQAFAESAEQAFRSLASRWAAEAGWIGLQSQIRRSSGDAAAVRQAQWALEAFLFRYPESRFQRRARWERTQLECATLEPEEAVDRWIELESDPTFATEARLQRVIALHRACQKYWDSPDRPHWMSQFETFSQEVIAGSQEVAVRLRVELLRLHLNRRLGQNSAEIHDQLARILEMATQVPQRSPLRAEALYQQLATLGADSPPELSIGVARDLLQASEDPGLREFAWSVICLQLENQQGNSSSREQLLELRDAYQEWSAALAAIDRGPRATHIDGVARRVARLSLEVDDLPAAEFIVDDQLKRLPPDVELLQLAGNLRMKAGRYDEAAVYWRQLVTGAVPGSETWRQAKFELARCLAESDPRAAIQLLEQSKQLDPELPPEWIARFDDLIRACQIRLDPLTKSKDGYGRA